MNDIKKMLISKSNEQNIHDLSQNIIKKTDASKVMIYETKARQPWFKLTGVLGGLCMALVLALILALNNSPSAPSDKNFENVEITDSFVIETYAYQAYTLGSIAISSDNVGISTASTNLTEEAETLLVNDIDNYIITIEELFGIVDFEYNVDINRNNVYAYDNILTVLCDGEVSYNLFYTETIISSNVDDPDYLYNSILDGELVIGVNHYPMTGFKNVQDSKSEFEMKINTSSNTFIEINQDFRISRDKYNYRYYTNSKLTKEINIEVLTNTSGNKIVQFQNGINSVEMCYDNSTISVKIKSSNSDYVYITRNELEYNYIFKNSSREYKKARPY